MNKSGKSKPVEERPSSTINLGLDSKEFSQRTVTSARPLTRRSSSLDPFALALIFGPLFSLLPSVPNRFQPISPDRSHSNRGNRGWPRIAPRMRHVTPPPSRSYEEPSERGSEQASLPDRETLRKKTLVFISLLSSQPNFFFFFLSFSLSLCFRRRGLQKCRDRVRVYASTAER